MTVNASRSTPEKDSSETDVVTDEDVLRDHAVNSLDELAMKIMEGEVEVTDIVTGFVDTTIKNPSEEYNQERMLKVTFQE